MHRSVYKKYYGFVPFDEFGRKYEIHHIDSNHENNQPENLKAITIKEHYDIHYKNYDWMACWMIAKRMDLSPKVISELSKKSNKRRVDEGTHHFLGGEIAKKSALKRIKEGKFHFQGDGSFQREVQEKRIKEGTHPFQVKAICPHCKKEGQKPAMMRFHFENCKKVKNVDITI